VTDVVDPATRSRMMSGIQGRNTKPEIVVRKALFTAGFRFRLHRKDLPGSPDIVLQGCRVAVFVHGCFWHAHPGCRYAKMPASKTEFWEAKLGANAKRDRRAIDMLISDGWRVLVVWECATRASELRDFLPELLNRWICGTEVSGEICSDSTPP
jgi:DNA mismatch endonuclease (patch repair protein)